MRVLLLPDSSGAIDMSMTYVGETVNVASRIEASGIENRISVSRAVVEQASARFSFENRGRVDLKGIGSTEVYSCCRTSTTAMFYQSSDLGYTLLLMCVQYGDL